MCIYLYVKTILRTSEVPKLFYSFSRVTKFTDIKLYVKSQQDFVFVTCQKVIRKSKLRRAKKILIKKQLNGGLEDFKMFCKAIIHLAILKEFKDQ